VEPDPQDPPVDVDEDDERTKLELLRPFIEALAELIVDDILRDPK
jgi:hypothetical protein